MVDKRIKEILTNPKFKDYINDGEWEKLYDIVEGYPYYFDFELMTELYDLINSLGIKTIEPKEVQLMHKYLGAEGILNNVVKERAILEEGNSYGELYRKLIPYIGNKVKIIDLNESDNYEDELNIDSNFSWLFWDLDIEGFGIAEGICGECINFPQYGIKYGEI